MTELQSYGQQFWMDRQAMYHSFAPLALDLLSAPASEAYVERIFSPLRNAYCWKTKSAEEELGDACLPEAEQ